MRISEEALQTLNWHLPEGQQITHRPDGKIMLETEFVFPDGDSYVMHLSYLHPGRIRLSDYGHTLMRASFEHSEHRLSDTQNAAIQRIAEKHQIGHQEGAFYVDCAWEHISETATKFGEALKLVYEAFI